jgi:hypothetical protein
MLPKSRKAVFAALVIALMLCAASVPAVTADSHGAAAMTQLEPGAEQWHTLICSGDGTVEVGMDVDPDGGAAFMIVTPDAVRAWEAGEDLIATGRGADNPVEAAELFWSGSCKPGEELYLIVEYTGDGTIPSSYSLHVTGAEVSGEAAADGLWCYMPVFDKIAPITFDPYEGNPAKAFWQVPYLSEWSGFLNGSSKDYGLVIIHVLDPGPPPVEAPVLFIDTSTFTDAEVGGASGGLELEAMGDLDPSGQWRGMWKVTSGTGGLEGLQAHGAFWGPGWLPPDGGSDECPEGMGVVYYSVDD